jgi:hypothetical protein
MQGKIIHYYINSLNEVKFIVKKITLNNHLRSCKTQNSRLNLDTLQLNEEIIKNSVQQIVNLPIIGKQKNKQTVTYLILQSKLNNIQIEN